MTNQHVDLDRIMQLCRIELTDDEKRTLTQQLDTMLHYLDQIQEVDIEGVEPLYHSVEACDVLREDVPGENFSVDEALQNAPDTREHQITVPRIVD
ncbi:MAG: Asp-tRNA(Asn)/Glu-tRNA(Gln) amidotransferase subunit GatC [Verrucomicrobiota bacterium]|nr:MAG: Asp-tRNA(Asn)/Glu-tRNA(Gln) amidotransferase subunit GatC [Verrucomicrobiota bacterium]